MMTSRKLRPCVFLLLALLIANISGCPSNASGRNGDIVIGAALPITGASAKMGQDMKNAIQMALEEINANGGILGRQLKLEVQDECDPQMAVAAANKLVRSVRSRMLLRRWASTASATSCWRT